MPSESALVFFHPESEIEKPDRPSGTSPRTEGVMTVPLLVRKPLCHPPTTKKRGDNLGDAL
jgi:hypothetical protein